MSTPSSYAEIRQIFIHYITFSTSSTIFIVWWDSFESSGCIVWDHLIWKDLCWLVRRGIRWSCCWRNSMVIFFILFEEFAWQDGRDWSCYTQNLLLNLIVAISGERTLVFSWAVSWLWSLARISLSLAFPQLQLASRSSWCCSISFHNNWVWSLS